MQIYIGIYAHIYDIEMQRCDGVRYTDIAIDTEIAINIRYCKRGSDKHRDTEIAINAET